MWKTNRAELSSGGTIEKSYGEFWPDKVRGVIY